MHYTEQEYTPEGHTPLAVGDTYDIPDNEDGGEVEHAHHTATVVGVTRGHVVKVTCSCGGGWSFYNGAPEEDDE